jgi:nucleoside-diphosphate-sugar epimerase
MKILVVGRGYLANVFRYSIVSSLISESDQVDILSLGEVTDNSKILNFYDSIVYATGPSNAYVDEDTILKEKYKAQHFLNLIKQQKLVLLSSGGTVYGDQGTRSAMEDDLLMGSTPYAKYQIYLEKLFLLKCSDSLILRLSNPYGIGQKYKVGQGFIWAGIKASIADTVLQVYGDGQQIRDYIYDEDMIGYVLDLIVRSKVGVYNIGSGDCYTLGDVISIIEQISAKKLKIKFNPGQGGGLKNSKLNVSKLESESLYVKKYLLSDGIKELIKCAVD